MKRLVISVFLFAFCGTSFAQNGPGNLTQVLADLQAQIDALEARIAQNESDIATNRTSIEASEVLIGANAAEIGVNRNSIEASEVVIGINSDDIGVNRTSIEAGEQRANGLEELINTNEGSIVAVESKVVSIESLLINVTRGTDPHTGQDTLQFSGMNVQINNGSGITDSANGVGNLIIGYNEPREQFPGECDLAGEPFCDRRSGSHTFVVGTMNNYTEAGGIVAGSWNERNSFWSSVLGGGNNVASGEGSSVSGGSYGSASGPLSSVQGGSDNVASGLASSVSGGQGKNAAGLECWEGDTTENC